MHWFSGRRIRGLAFVSVTAVAMAMLLWPGCNQAPVTGRKQLVVMPEAQEITLGKQAYDEMLADEPKSTNKHYIDMVNRVGRRIASVAEKSDYDWEFTVIASEQQNAFALPGGKVAIYEGILPICENEAGLAVVMSHEVAHALARHGGERMSHSTLAGLAQKGLEYASQNQGDAQKKMLLGAYGAASKYGVLLPYSRKQESEADHIGLMLMAKAGYNPEEAPRFWERFSRVGGDKPPEFLSTHPADSRRAADLKALLPEAMGIYAQAPGRIGIGEKLQIARSALTRPTGTAPARNAFRDENVIPARATD